MFLNVHQGSITRQPSNLVQVQIVFYLKNSFNNILLLEDVDECLTGENNCNKESQICLNIKGNYTCVDKKSRCPPGFKKNVKTQLCEGKQLYNCSIN